MSRYCFFCHRMLKVVGDLRSCPHHNRDQTRAMLIGHHDHEPLDAGKMAHVIFSKDPHKETTV